MRNIFIISLLSCLSGIVFAACPVTIQGDYSGYGTYTEIYGATNIVGKLYNLSLDGKGTATKQGVVKIKRYVEVDAIKAAGIYDETTVIEMPYKYDKASCTVTMTTKIALDGAEVIFLVANSGNTLYGIKQEKGPDGTYMPTVEQFILTKQ